jgi:hypothetical protein
MSWKGVAAIVLAAGPGLPAAARAADPGRWTLTGTTTLPLVNYRGRRVLRTHRGRLRLSLRASVREPSGTVTHRTARVRLR